MKRKTKDKTKAIERELRAIMTSARAHRLRIWLDVLEHEEEDLLSIRPSRPSWSRCPLHSQFHKVFHQTELRGRLEKLEARIAALEAK